jgi:hypothetical protein
MESIMQDPNVQELIHEWEDKGRAEGRAAEARLLLHKVLAARSFRVPPDLRARIDREPDLARIESWLEAAVTAHTIGDVFEMADQPRRRARAASRASPRLRPTTRRPT